MYPWYRDSMGGQLGQLCGPMATTIKTENGYNDCMLALDYATQSKKAFGWDGTQTGGSPAGPQTGGVGGQGAQGLVHWMSVMAEHMDPAVSHYMSWNQETTEEDMNTEQAENEISQEEIIQTLRTLKTGKAAEINQCISKAIADKFDNAAIVTNIVQEVSDKLLIMFNDKLKAVEEKLSEENKVLRDKIDSLQQYSRRNNVRFFGVSEEKNEVVEEKVIKILEEKMNIKVASNDIERIHRVGQAVPNKPRPVIIKFSNYKTRQTVLRNRRRLKGTGLLLQEDLTIDRLNMLKTAQQKWGLRNVWTQDGMIITIQNNRKLFIRSYDDLQKYIT
ncbi:hypothetical protein RI129_013061 [Pyrocoelia pectoralis]|uniref:Uncharacterized protein n=1 Tax=Pyrocoelia pectoralis TaxID=417401 RepID=A0AAN7ZFK7_9COLE